MGHESAMRQNSSKWRLLTWRNPTKILVGMWRRNMQEYGTSLMTFD